MNDIFDINEWLPFKTKQSVEVWVVIREGKICVTSRGKYLFPSLAAASSALSYSIKCKSPYAELQTIKAKLLSDKTVEFMLLSDWLHRLAAPCPA
jgi:hypothetical protein